MINIKNIYTYYPSNFFEPLSLYKKINKKFLNEKIGANKLLRKNLDESVIDMCLSVAKKAKFKKKSVKAVVLCTQNPEHNSLPHNSAIIQNKLKLSNNIAAFDISQGCAGYLYCLEAITPFLKKKNDIGLIFTCDPYSKIIKKGDYNTELLFGDASTLTVVENSIKKGKGKKLYKSDYFTSGREYKSIINNDGVLKMDGKNVMNFCSNEVVPFVKKFLNKENIKQNTFDKIFLHQGSKYIIETIYRKLECKTNQKVFPIKNIGNTVSSSIPILLKKNNFLKLKKILICGFGVGLSISVGVLI
jgi:3-oxoacyl-[acyl-carrier-protein] synthase III